MQHRVVEIALALAALSLVGSAQATNIQIHGTQFKPMDKSTTEHSYSRVGLVNSGTHKHYILGAVQSFEYAYYDVYVDGQNTGSNVLRHDVWFCAYDYKGNERSCKLDSPGGATAPWTAHVQFAPSEANGGYISIDADLTGTVTLLGAGVYHW